jgi:uncharacterized protein
MQENQNEIALRDLKKYQFFQKLQALPFIEKIILYGSRARGDSHERSDIDLAIVCPKASEKNWLQVVNIVDDADTLLKIDIVQLEKLSDQNPLRQAILRDGIVLHNKEI